MRLLLQAMDDPTEEVTHAVVEVDLDEIMKRRKLLDSIKDEDMELVKVCFWDAIIFFNVDLEAVDQKLHDDFEAEFDQWMVLPEDIDTDTEEWSIVRTDCEMMVLHDNVVSWQAYPKYGPVGIITTTGLSYEQVEDLKGETDESSEGDRES